MRVKFFTLGCKVNQYETQGLKEQFLHRGHKITEEKADLYIINTCTVTSRADSKSKDTILRAKKENPEAKIAVSGCLAQLNRDFIAELGVDYIISQDQKAFLPDIILGFPSSKKAFKITRFSNHRAFVKVQDGCDNSCSFCKIPYLRGSSRSKTKAAAIAEIKKVCRRHKEIVLCGVNLGLWGRDLTPESTLGSLVKDLLKVSSLGRLRLSSLEPLFLNQELFSLLHHEKLCPHFHFPFQYGDDRILAEMNKKETVNLYQDKVFQIRKIRPEAAISCDIMVGFPTESEESFRNTVNFLTMIKPMRMHIFTFSPRENTRFSKVKIKDSKIIRQRYNFLRRLSSDFARNYKQKFLGKILNMVAEEENQGYISGHTENYIRVWIKDKISLGQIVPVAIEAIDGDKVFVSLARSKRNNAS
ncbi:MAG: tRNA (N(6)-L-threonylcarbamoyladenosine(37)-C(2))-methylthiotransferase MtaB [Candidatus Omnitrophota bacterium]